MNRPGAIDPPRELRDDELAVLEKLLSIDFPGVDQLRQQVPLVRVREEDPHPYLTIGLVVDQAAAPKADTGGSVPVTAVAPLTDSIVPIMVLLHVWDGYLDELEVVPPEDGLSFPMPDANSLTVRAWS